MDKDYVVEGNKLLAHYMGYEYIPSNNKHGWKAGWWKRTTHPRFRLLPPDGTVSKLHDHFYLCRNHNQLRYYNNWDWLMPVLDKLEKKGYTSSLKTRYARLNPIEGEYYEYVTMVRWNEESFTVTTNIGEVDEFGLIPTIFGKIESINKLQAVFVMLVEAIKITQPELLTKL